MTAVLYATLFLGRHRYYLTYLFFVVASIASYFIHTFKTQINGDTIAIVIETSFFEAKEFVNFDILSWGALSILISTLFIVSTPELRITKRSTIPLAVLSIILVCAYQFFNTKNFKEKYDRERVAIMNHNIVPFSVINAFGEYYEAQQRIDKLGPLQNSGNIPSIKLNDAPQYFILVIGESARADHFGINGYARATTPKLSSLDNVYSFTNVTSYAATTRQSVPIMITRATSQAPDITATSVLDVFQKQGFSTHWFSLNDRFNKHNNPTTRLITNIPDKRFRSAFHVAYKTAKDHIMLPAIEQLINTESHPSCIALHTRGSHWAYTGRYAEEFAHWIPTSSDVERPDEIINAYDNSILMTDDFIFQVIDSVRDKNAVVVYCSDHGESLGENGFFNHGCNERPEQRRVPLIVWLSNSYKAHHPDIAASIAAHTNAPISHDYLYESLLSLGCIQQQNYRPSLDFTSPQMVAGHGSLVKPIAKH